MDLKSVFKELDTLRRQRQILMSLVVLWIAICGLVSLKIMILEEDLKIQKNTTVYLEKQVSKKDQFIINIIQRVKNEQSTGKK